jgi:hypothetical protein
MSAALVKPPDAAAIEKVILGGDLKDLTPGERLAYYNRVCESLSLNPLTQPFAYLSLSGKLTLYARKDAAEQLRKVNAITLRILSREMIDGMYVVTCQAETPTGRSDASTGVIDLSKLAGEAKANAMMKAETKAKRRVTLSICGLGLIDETEVESVPGARKIRVEDAHSGKLLEDGAASNPQPAAPVERPIPEELSDAVTKLRAGDGSVIAPACTFLEDEMLKLGIPEAYANRKAGLRASFPKGKSIPTEVMVSFMLDCWDEIEKARSAKEKPEDDKADYLPEGMFPE